MDIRAESLTGSVTFPGLAGRLASVGMPMINVTTRVSTRGAEVAIQQITLFRCTQINSG
jgi:hypothetical protein